MLCNNRIKKRGTGRWILEWGIDLVIWKICTFQVPQPNGGRKMCLGNQDKKGAASPNNLKDPITSSFIQIKLQHSSVSLLDANLQRCEFYHTLSTTSPSLWSTVTVGKSNPSRGSLSQHFATLSVKNPPTPNIQRNAPSAALAAFPWGGGRGPGEAAPAAGRQGAPPPCPAASGAAAGRGRAGGKRG